MRLRILIPLATVFILQAGCSGDSNIPPGYVPSTEIYEVPTLPVLPTLSAPTPTSTSVPTTVPLELKIVEGCFQFSEVSIEKLEMKDGMGVLYYPDENKQSVWFVSPSHPEPFETFASFYDGVDNTVYGGVGPDGKRLIREHEHFGGEGKEYDYSSEVWVQSILGGDEERIAEIRYEGVWLNGLLTVSSATGEKSLEVKYVKFGPGIGWDKNGNILIFTHVMESPSASHLYPVVIVDPSSGRIEPYFKTIDFLKHINDGFLMDRMVFEGQGYDLFLDEHPGCSECNSTPYLQSPITDKKVSVFRWLHDNEALNIPDIFLRAQIWQDWPDRISIIVTQPHGLDIALGLSFSEATSDYGYSEVMTRLDIPGEGFFSDKDEPPVYMHLPNVIIEWVSRDGNTILARRTNEGSAIYYIIRLDKMQIQSLCEHSFDIYSPTESIDGKFIVADHLPYDGLIRILDLETGGYATIKGERFRDWVIID